MAEEVKKRWLWERLREGDRAELDALEQKLVARPGEKRAYVGDPNQPRKFWVRTRNK